MYTFVPLESIPASHSGFFFVVFICAAILLSALSNFRESFFACFFYCAVVCGVAYGVSYHWTDQSAKVFANEKVIGTFVKFETEGYNETTRSGKTTTHVDRHLTYVVYSVNGNNILLNATAGVEYPQRAVLYKN